MNKFLDMQFIDPAVGSGIFLRTILETQLENIAQETTIDKVRATIQKAYGIDLDENAAQATKLSLSLLHLVLTDELPSQLNVFSGEAIEFFQYHQEYSEMFDAVIANPPFISLDTQEPAMRQRIGEFMNEFGSGRMDMYLAFLRIGIELLKPGGYGLFVLPHSFLITKSAKKMREYLTNSTWIRCLADLSAIRVFEDSGIYVILLILQKKLETTPKIEPDAMIIKCQDFVGRALQEAIEGQRLENSFYSIYDVKTRCF